MTKTQNVSAVILAGGKSRRLGRDKVTEPVGGIPLIDRVLQRVSSLSDETVVVVDSRERFDALSLPEPIRCAVDKYPGKGSLGGIFTGIEACESEWALVVACDMPFLSLSVFDHMLSIRCEFDAVVPVLNGFPEPAHALYSKACLPHIEKRLVNDDLKIAGFFEDVNIRYVPEDDIDKLDPRHLSFFNINTEEQLQQANNLAAEGF